MTSDLGLPIEVIGRPIVRESDGLAMSSRNTYLSALDRPRALALSRGLRAAQAAFAKGERGPQALVALARQPVQAAELREDYVELCDPETLKPLASTTQATPDSRLLVAAFVGKTRLIDNVRLGG